MQKFGDNQCLIHNMGKVGSISVQVGIKQAGYKSLHAHYIRGLPEAEYATTKPPLEKSLRTGGPPYKIISLTRDPVARNISAFFQGLHKYYPAYKRMEVGDDTVQAFLDNYKHYSIMNWWIHEFGYFYGPILDSKRFNKSKGYQIYKDRKREILIMRVENFENLNFRPVADFLGIEDKVGKMPKSNFMRKKRIGRFYLDFLEYVKLPEEYLEETYNTPYAQYFYEPWEIEKFKNRWR